MSSRCDDDDAEEDVLVMDASLHRCCWVPCALLHCGFWPYSTVLTLRPDTLTRHDTALCGERVSVRKYAELGTVQAGSCGCLLCVDYSGSGTAANGGSLLPSFGCDREMVDYIITELLARQTARGAAANRELQERVAARTEVIREKTRRLEEYFSGLAEQPAAAKRSEEKESSPAPVVAALSMEDR